MLWPQASQQVSGSSNIVAHGNIAISQNTTITNKAGQTLNVRYWADLTMEERRKLKAEAIRRFPQIKQIGSGVDWRSIIEWFVEEKGVVQTNIRDVFR